MPTPSRELQEILVYRGVEGLVAAEVLADDENGYQTGPVFAIAGVAEISRTTDSSSEAQYYDNIPAVVISSTSADEITISTSAIPFDVLATITGQYYDATTGAFIEGPRDTKYFAIGYITKKNNGDKVYVWRLKCSFNIPDQTNVTENDSTDANGQELVCTGISTTHKFTKTGKGAKALNVDLSKDLADVSTFFDTVTTPDTLQPKNPPVPATYTLSITEGSGTTVEVMRSGVELMDGDTLNAGDVLTITVVGGTVTVNGVAFTSGDTYTVTGNVIVQSSY